MYFIICTVGGVLIAKFFIFPDDVVNLKLAAMTIGDIWRIVWGVIVVIVGAVIGGNIDSTNRYHRERE